ncbi:uncharacterized protein N7500_000800 [Penicillium coprophilum]|uniref:uncharacterized protein n=1 Tax=Penicillium coprophilum TaxID=36646 RepID=UPI0023985C4A|nr:uncharacterized protein N7500_000800 [Penicillium coprophilum]KAJ5178101.1 hypothetical protein N7500_000800 [Penicillium coprophilum]
MRVDFTNIGENNIVPAAAKYFKVTFQADRSELSCFPNDQNCAAISVCDTDAPAGGLIFDSFSSIQTYFSTLYDTVNVADQHFAEKLDFLAKILVQTHKDHGNQILNIILDVFVFSLVFGTLSGVHNKLGSNRSSIYNQTVRFVRDTGTGLFLGNDTESIQGLMSGGAIIKTIDFAENQSLGDIAQSLWFSVFVTMLIPLAWSISYHTNPVVLSFDCRYQEGADHWGIKNKDAKMLRITAGDYTLYLLNVPEVHICSKGDLILLPAIDQLSMNNTEWGNVTFADTMISTMLIDGAGTKGEFTIQNFLATAGVFGIPVCKVYDIIWNGSEESPGELHDLALLCRLHGPYQLHAPELLVVAATVFFHLDFLFLVIVI